jgi:MFS family permease
MANNIHCINGNSQCVSASVHGRGNSELMVAFRTAASSIYASTYPQLIKEFHTSQEVATLGLSLFVVGLAISPMVLGPLSEVICLCIESSYHFTDIFSSMDGNISI